MKKILLTLLFSTSLMAGDYDTIVYPYMEELRTEFISIHKETKYIASGLVAISSIDFTQAEGFSIGAGYAELSTYLGSSKAGAVGINYGYENINLSVKGWKTSEAHAIGIGFTIGL